MDTKTLQQELVASLTDLPRLGMDVHSLVEAFRRYYTHTLGRDRHCGSIHYAYQALVLSLRDRLLERWKQTRYGYDSVGAGHAYYLSLEFLMGRALGNAALNLNLDEEAELAVSCLGMELEELMDVEQDAGLGNGGLGRLASCFLDSCATLQLPVTGYGLRYEYGMFRQSIRGGEQIERPDHWLREGNPWELERPEYTQRVRFGGHTEWQQRNGNRKPHWVSTHDVLAVPYDVPIPGYNNGTVNTLRLWKACSTDEFDLEEFNAGFYPEAVAAKNSAELITLVLYPNDASENGKELRLRQQYFLASASLQDVIDRWVHSYGRDFSQFASKNRFQLNDTHPSCAVPELMRLLLDEQGLEWDEAWRITTATMAYTNHTLLPEALERWPVPIFRRLLPRIYEIICEINARFLAEVGRCWPGNNEMLRRMSIIEEGEVQQVRMAYLAIVGSFSVNGVAGLHSRLLAEGLFSDFHTLWPEKFNNKTNGVTPRRWLARCNPGLAELVTRTLGDKGWITDLSRLAELVPHAEDADFRKRWYQVKQQNKQRLAELVGSDCGVQFDPEALFDVQVKRIHEYKRQLLNLLHVVHLYDRLKRGDADDWTPRCVLIGGKAAPGYFIAKRIIKMVNNVASVINADPVAAGKLRLAFLPNYRVTAMEIIAPGADLSEQISTAGKEASGTGNMKFMMNGALTIGTLDGANIEIREEVGEENFFLFGLTAEQVEEQRRHYDPAAIIAADPELQRVMALLQSGHFNQLQPGIFDPVLEGMTSPNDPWMTLADFRPYVEAQRRVAQLYRDREAWTRMSILNSAASGRFSSDRTIAEYNRDIWKLKAVAPLEKD